MCLFTHCARSVSRATLEYLGRLLGFKKAINHEVPRRKNLIRNHSLNFRRIRIADKDGAAKPAFALLVLRSQDVPQKCMRSLDFSTRGFLEALSCAFMCLQFRHKTSAIAIQLSAQ